MVEGQMPSTGWSPISRTDSTRALGYPVATTCGLHRSQVQLGDMGWAYRQASTRTSPGTIGAVLCDPGRWLLRSGRVGRACGSPVGSLAGVATLSEGITSPVGSQAI
jgi:hypothetical protein